MPAPSLELREVGVTLGGTRILQHVSLRVRGGELVALLGPSGCGKSTLLKVMAGLLRPSNGELRGEWTGLDNGKRAAGSVGYVPQDDIVHTALKVRAALEYAALLRLPAEMPEPGRRARVDHVLKLLSLGEHQHKRVRQLSGGQRKRVSVGVELLTSPAVLLMDEPTSGLDPALEEQLMRSLRELTGTDRMTLLSTHAMASLQLCDLVLVMAKGQLAFVGPPPAALVHFGVEDFNAMFKILVAESVARLARAWEASPWRKRLMSQDRAVGRQLH
jgi:ABC-type multidrug transport system ATPase subunit